MLSILFKILSILGILLLCLLGFLLVAVLLILFFPVFYGLAGVKNAQEQRLAVRASWLFGFLRLSYDYETSGRLKIKMLFFSLYDSDKKLTKKRKEKKAESKTAKESEETGEEGIEKEDAEREAPISEEGESPEMELPKIETESKKFQQTNAETQGTAAGQTFAEKKAPKLFHKIKYTIQNIYDKIKKIWNNISYYTDLLREEDTKKMFSDCMFRIGKIWKNIRPGKIRGNILFGTGEPDVTGYLYGVYSIFNGILPSRIIVAPDSMQPVLEGELYVSGHITVFTVLWNGIQLVFDKNIKQFIQKWKAGRKK